MYRILVPVDADTDRALGQASYVTSLPIDPASVEVVLAHALSEPEGESRIAFLDSLFDWPPVREGASKGKPAERTPGYDPDRVESVRRAAEHLNEHGFDINVEEVTRPVQEGILDLADDIDADVIVMGGRKRSPAGKAVFGSVTQGVILNSGIPVAVTGNRD